MAHVTPPLRPLITALRSPTLSRRIPAFLSLSRSPGRFRCSMAKRLARVAVAQMTSTSDLDANFNTCSRLVEEAAAAGAVLVCFPENFSFVGEKRGDSLTIAEDIDGPVMRRYCSLARKSKIWLSLGGFQEKGPEDSHLCNTHVIVDDYGNIRSKYRKIHLFDVDVPGSMVYKESTFTSAGADIVIQDSPIGRLGVTVCYDLRFPDLYQRLRFQHQADVLLVPSAFTKITGEAHWEVLLRARAIETQCYVIAAAQAGKHNDQRESYGDSIIIDPWGTIICRLPDRLSTGVATVDVDLSVLDTVRERMPIHEGGASRKGMRSTFLKYLWGFHLLIDEAILQIGLQGTLLIRGVLFAKLVRSARAALVSLYRGFLL